LDVRYENIHQGLGCSKFSITYFGIKSTGLNVKLATYLLLTNQAEVSILFISLIKDNPTLNDICPGLSVACGIEILSSARG
jgi:hypothetical protein